MENEAKVNQNQPMEEMDIIWSVQDIVDALEERDIPVTGENVRRVLTPEFIRNLQERLTQTGNEMIAARVEAVFGVSD